MKRKRAHINMHEKLAAALVCLLPQEWRDELRDKKVPAADVIALFEWDHIVLHALDGDDKWHNLHPTLRVIHREKSKRDTSIVAKVKRIEPRWKEFMTKMVPGSLNYNNLSIPAANEFKAKRRWPKRKMQSRKCATASTK